MQERRWITVLIPAVLLFGITSFASPAAAGSAKVDVCHFPPGNPDNFHTITISEKAFSKHLAHGDLGGACNDLCATICDDGNACTIDDTADCEEVGCPTDSTPVDCDDDNECTADSCDAESGCVNTASVGAECDDDQLCSGPDVCDTEGACQGPAIDNCCLGDGDCSQDPCDQASCNLGTNRCGEDPVVCDPPNLCTVSECASDTGECVEAPVACAEGEVCNTNGECVVQMQVTFTPDRDITMLAGFYQNFNYGGCEILAVGGIVQGNGRGGDERVIIGFDVAALSGQFTSIDAITLRLVVERNTPSGQSPYTLMEQVFAVSAANRDWTEGSGPCAQSPVVSGDSTWSGRHFSSTPWAGLPGLGTPDIDYVDTLLASREFEFSVVPSVDTLPNAGDTIDFTFTGSSTELTSLIDTWLVDNVANSQRNPGLLLLDTNGPNVAPGSVERVVAHSRESVNPALRPQLIVTYTP